MPKSSKNSISIFARGVVFWVKWVGGSLVLGLILLGIGIYGYCKPRYDLAKSFDLSNFGAAESPSRIVDRKGAGMGSMLIQDIRPVLVSEVSEQFIQALISIEDPDFFEHQDVNLIGVLRAVVANYRAGEMVAGGSTITWQLVRDSGVASELSVSRAVTELFLAYRVEQELGSKEKILGLYINRSYFGEGFFGIANASAGYFGKSPADLSLSESATLAGLVRNPYYRSPISFPVTAREVRDAVLTRMHEEGYIGHASMQRAQAGRILVRPKAR